MAKKNGAASEKAQETALAQEASQNTQAAETASATPENAAEEAGMVLYQVSAPRGIYLRMGPGRAYHPLGVLENGAEVMGVDLAGMLRTDRKPGEAAWIKVLSQNGTGWVDSAFLERCF